MLGGIMIILVAIFFSRKNIETINCLQANFYPFFSFISHFTLKKVFILFLLFLLRKQFFCKLV